MKSLRRLLRTDSGSAAVEMALVLPLLLGIMFGSVELGNYFLSEHKLVKSVRDGARFASRQGFSHFDCSTGTVDSTVADPTEDLVRTGTPAAGGTDQLNGWDDGTFDISVACETQVAAGEDADGNPVNQPMGGIYSGSAVGAPVVTVSASVPYTPLLASFGFNATGFSLNASQQSAVMGI
jgi:Flp pilus assembly protein TadG